MKIKQKSSWLKNRGYLHLTNQIDVYTRKSEVLGKVSNPSFVAKHDFFPLLHTIISERRYKRAKDGGNDSRAHSHNGEPTVKDRPLHYATHMDSMVFGYYAELLQKDYLLRLQLNPLLSDCVTAYRRIEDPKRKGKNKGTIHFASEVFQEIEKRALQGCTVLKFDIESFFSSIDHKMLKQAWIDLLQKPTMPTDHYNVYRASTRFSYINRDDLRMPNRGHGGRSGFDEKRLARIRKLGVVAFFESPRAFRDELKLGKFCIHKNKFKNEAGEMIGIPQGLPISAVLANLYLLKPDTVIFKEIVEGLGGYYRRYSDDIIVICKPEEKQLVKDIVEKSLSDNKVKVSIPKTEEFFYHTKLGPSGNRIQGYKIEKGEWKVGAPLTYLGFEFDGVRTLIKSANVAKFYRRMVFAVKSRTRRAMLSAAANPDLTDKLFKRRLFRLYANINLEKSYKHHNLKRLERNVNGEYVYQIEVDKREFRSNYFSYARRADEIMNQRHILRQLRRHRSIFRKTVRLQLEKFKARQNVRLSSNL
ncbi:reverse transcriptase domain-containing protein [Pedobacter ghigonis]|uniref:reverse transcriptase domain-containing protein n=1 Tax=Pedobacter ghigonis TaxID=2730403 RepID=UPI00158C5BBA|nr:reverse transcriptase domain-containing protein [Pedobacter ghigonis]